MLAPLLVSADPARAKCAAERYIISGAVKEASGTGVQGAKVFVFFESKKKRDRASCYWSYVDWRNPNRYPDWFPTSTEGEFQGECMFDTTKGYYPWGKHACGKTPRNIVLFVVKDGYPAWRTTLPFKRLKLSKAADGSLVEIPEIKIPAASRASLSP